MDAPKKYVPPHKRGQGTSTPPPTTTEYHYLKKGETWNEAREAVKQWLIKGGWESGMQYTGIKSTYHAFWYPGALQLNGSVYNLVLHIHTDGSAGACWISKMEHSDVQINQEPDVPY